MTPLTTKAAEIRAGLVERLRDDRHCNDWYLRQEAAALIEQQAAELAEARGAITERIDLARKTAASLQGQIAAESARAGRWEAAATTAESERDELLREKAGLTKERDEARAYLKAFCRACVDSEFDRNPVGVHEANPSLGWIFTLDDMDVCPQQHITGGQVRRAMEIVGFDKLKIEPAARTISDELSENRAAARTAEATASSQSERIAVLEAALRRKDEALDWLMSEIEGERNLITHPNGRRAHHIDSQDEIRVELLTALLDRARSALAPLGEE